MSTHEEMDQQFRDAVERDNARDDRMAFAHPETGEVLESQDDFHKALYDINERLAPLWRVRHDLQMEYTERWKPTLPQRRSNRTDKQEKVARCPRCRALLENVEA